MKLSYAYTATTLLLFLSAATCSGEDDAERVQSKIISVVSDGAGWFKIVNGVVKGAILRANFTDMINTTGSVVPCIAGACCYQKCTVVSDSRALLLVA